MISISTDHFKSIYNSSIGIKSDVVKISFKKDRMYWKSFNFSDNPVIDDDLYKLSDLDPVFNLCKLSETFYIVIHSSSHLEFIFYIKGYEKIHYHIRSMIYIKHEIP